MRDSICCFRRHLPFFDIVEGQLRIPKFGRYKMSFSTLKFCVNSCRRSALLQKVSFRYRKFVAVKFHSQHLIFAPLAMLSFKRNNNKLVFISSQLYGQLSRRPMAYFSPFDNVYTLIAFAHAVTNENRRFSTRRKNPSAHAWRISRISLSKGPEAPRSTRAGRARARARAR